MTIAALSDIHEEILKNVLKGDIVCICGDIFPQDIERDIQSSYDWFN